MRQSAISKASATAVLLEGFGSKKIVTCLVPPPHPRARHKSARRAAARHFQSHHDVICQSFKRII
jgi:hypothetical protein